MSPQVRRAKSLLHFVFVLIPLAAGVDKYFHLLTNWDQYVSPIITRMLGENGVHVFMSVDGVIETLIGIGVAARPRVFANVFAAWLLGIVINLLTTGHFYDIALRDTGLALSALALGVLSRSVT